MLKSLIVFFMLSSPMAMRAVVIETAEIETVLPYLDNDTWFLIDLDNTLYQAKQSLGHVFHYYDLLDEEIARGKGKEEAFLHVYPYWAQLQESCSVEPLEDNFVPALQDLQERGVCLMGFTHRHPMVSEATLSQVASLDLDFRVTAPSRDEFIVPARNHAIYSGGILFCHDFNLKSEVFLSFIELIQTTPKKVVFIDDKRKNVEEVVEVLSQKGIECIGVHYTAIDQVESYYSKSLIP